MRLSSFGTTKSWLKSTPYLRLTRPDQHGGLEILSLVAVLLISKLAQLNLDLRVIHAEKSFSGIYTSFWLLPSQ